MTSDTNSAYDEAAVYVVKLTRPVTWRGSRFLPLHEHEMTGRVLNAIVEQEGADVVDRAQP